MTSVSEATLKLFLSYDYDLFKMNLSFQNYIQVIHKVCKQQCCIWLLCTTNHWKKHLVTSKAILFSKNLNENFE